MIPNGILMVRPRHFGFNPQTAESNAFQQKVQMQHPVESAKEEFDSMVRQLREEGIDILVAEDPEIPCADAVFPNNWLVAMPDQTLIVFPVMAPNRRNEINPATVDMLRKEIGPGKLIDLSSKAEEGLFLEGTGSITFDYENRLAYASESKRTNLKLLAELCKKIGYESISFGGVDLSGKAIYHTNVLMSVGSKTVILCSESIESGLERKMLHERIRRSGKKLLEISYTQMQAFAGNAMEVKSSKGSCWVMSTTAASSLTTKQKQQLESDGKICAVHIPTIECLGGGSARCMMAGYFLKNQK